MCVCISCFSFIFHTIRHRRNIYTWRALEMCPLRRTTKWGPWIQLSNFHTNYIGSQPKPQRVTLFLPVISNAMLYTYNVANREGLIDLITINK